MEDPNSEEAEMPIPLNSTYCHGHMTHQHHHLHHNHHPITGGPPQIPLEDEMRNHQAKAIRYRECLKNHAAAIGGNATDGCGEFMAAGSGGALACSACGCHRNFHRKETDDEHNNINYPRRMYLGQQHQHYQISYRPHHHHETMMTTTTGDEARAPVGVGNKKRFRTKFTQEQKEKMLGFAEKVGWKIQKQEESVVQRFCQEVGVKRRVLKVWMHNNKHTLANNNKKSNNNSHHILNDHSNDINQVN